jgi:hypothetical protein
LLTLLIKNSRRVQMLVFPGARGVMLPAEPARVKPLGAILYYFGED